MNKKLRIIVGICFLMGAVIFSITKDYVYVPLFVAVGGLYIYKGTKG